MKKFYNLGPGFRSNAPTIRCQPHKYGVTTILLTLQSGFVVVTVLTAFVSGVILVALTKKYGVTASPLITIVTT